MPDQAAATSPQVRIEESAERLLDGLGPRQAWKNSDSLSGSRLERLSVDGRPHVLKYVSVDDDWIMRATGDIGCRQLTFLESGLHERVPDCIDTAIVAAAPMPTARGHRGLVLLMRDVSAGMIPPGNAPITMAAHSGFVDDMASLHAAFWGFHDTVGLTPLAHLYTMLSPAMADIERAGGRGDPVPPAVAEGWTAVTSRHPGAASRLLALTSDPWPLVVALRDGPQTLIHADWKLGNLGRTGPRTILLDWDRPAEAPGLVDLAWYLAVNCDRLPETKDAAIARYRQALDRRGVETATWWDRLLAPAMCGAFVQLAWAKAPQDDEFAWWERWLDRWSQD